jgi:GNAT superfamily N-acetyltransferase
MNDIKIYELGDEHDAAAFRDLNLEWIEKYFEVEPNDLKALNDPYKYIISKGGAVMMAALNGEIAGTCALVKVSDDMFELAKMAVSPKAQGKKIGYLLGKAVIEKAKALGASTVFLVSNTRLKPALGLYHKLGFTEIPLDSREYKRTDIKMELSLY